MFAALHNSYAEVYAQHDRFWTRGKLSFMIYFTFDYICVWVCGVECKYPQKPEALDMLEFGALGGCASPGVGTSIQTWVLWKNSFAPLTSEPSLYPLHGQFLFDDYSVGY